MVLIIPLIWLEMKNSKFINKKLQNQSGFNMVEKFFLLVSKKLFKLDKEIY